MILAVIVVYGVFINMYIVPLNLETSRPSMSMQFMRPTHQIMHIHHIGSCVSVRETWKDK